MVDAANLKALADELEKYPLLPAQKGPYTAMLADEDKPDGDVVLFNKDGAAVLSMPREVYDDLKKEPNG